MIMSSIIGSYYNKSMSIHSNNWSEATKKLRNVDPLAPLSFGPLGPRWQPHQEAGHSLLASFL